MKVISSDVHLKEYLPFRTRKLARLKPTWMVLQACKFVLPSTYLDGFALPHICSTFALLHVKRIKIYFTLFGLKTDFFAEEALIGKKPFLICRRPTRLPSRQIVWLSTKKTNENKKRRPVFRIAYRFFSDFLYQNRTCVLF